MRLRFVLAVVFVVAASGCGMVKVSQRIEEGQEVSINPCNVITLEQAAKIVGGPVVQVLNLYRSPEPRFSGCEYVQDGPASGGKVTLFVGRKATTDVGSPFVGTGVKVNQISNLGREAQYSYNTASQTLYLSALTDRGAKLEMNVSGVPKAEQLLLEPIKDAVQSAMAKMEKVFPGKDSPPREEPPFPPCSIVTEAELLTMLKGKWAPVANERIVFAESEQMGGLTRLGEGPIGGGWKCDIDVNEHRENPHYHFYWSISKQTPPESLLAASGERLKGLGAAAYWRKSSWYYGDDEGATLSVLTKGGRHFEVETMFEKEIDEPLTRQIAVDLARRLLTKLP
ncbi:MAG: hypothetical protein ABIS18_11120 [Actinomycetota bacterium]